VEKDYSAAEFESLTEQQRAKLGLRTFILEDLLPPKALPQVGQQMELRNFCFAYKNEPETLHIRESKIPANRMLGCDCRGNCYPLLLAAGKGHRVSVFEAD